MILFRSDKIIFYNKILNIKKLSIQKVVFMTELSLTSLNINFLRIIEFGEIDHIQFLKNKVFESPNCYA